MFCSFCGKEIANEAVVCINCGRAVPPVRSASSGMDVGAQKLHDVGQTFLGMGIFNIVVGILVTAVGYPLGLFSIVVGIIEIINSSTYRASPPKSTSKPTFVAILEIVNFISGPLWSAIAGIVNLVRLNSPEVTNYLLALQSGQVMPTGSPASLSSIQTKKCPKCAETIQAEALACRHCGQQFSEAEIGEAKRLAQAQTEQAQQWAKTKSRQQRGKTFTIIGGAVTAIGVFLLLVAVLAQVSSTAPSPGNTNGFIMAMLLCPVPLTIAGVLMLLYGIKVTREVREGASMPSAPTLTGHA